MIGKRSHCVSFAQMPALDMGRLVPVAPFNDIVDYHSVIPGEKQFSSVEAERISGMIGFNEKAVIDA